MAYAPPLITIGPACDGGTAGGVVGAYCEWTIPAVKVAPGERTAGGDVTTWTTGDGVRVELGLELVLGKSCWGGGSVRATG